MVVPFYFNNSEEQFQKAVREAIMIPLKEAFGGTVPVYRLSMSAVDYQQDPKLKENSANTAHEIFKRFLSKPALDCQKMVSLETRVKRLIQKHVALEEDHKKLQ